MKILITGGKTATALKLVKAFEGSEVVLGDYGAMPSITTSAYSFVELGDWNADVLAHNLLTKCLDYGIDMLVSLYEAEINAMAKSLVLFEEFGLNVLLPANPQYKSIKVTDWLVFDNGKLLYSSRENNLNLTEQATLNGVYNIDAETKELNLVSIPNP
ncbi:MAG: hypothetical protein REI64_13160 [Pedobacter sp.]|uniref:hypothetical protein n=1 Tax=Pedobacter sp. TaxID=1411316 RepID=UPI002809809F|nr:hypothetical protein [Pedobacter sp.]MDQ8005747.1 hypothetical protein [Pedobacter sp.]